jgi:hypothetical protein
MDLTSGQRIMAAHPEYLPSPVQVIFLRPGEDRVEVISHHPYVEQRRQQIWVRYADHEARFEGHEYLVDRDSVELIGA